MADDGRGLPAIAIGGSEIAMWPGLTIDAAAGANK